MRYSFLLLLVISLSCRAQNTLSLSEGETSPKANLNQVAFMEGHWRGEAFGGMGEEIWSPPLGGSMMFVFKHVFEGKITFYEIGHFKEKNETLVYELKHFDGELKGWEEKNEVQSFNLVKIEENKAYFDGFTFEKINDNKVAIYALIGDDNGGESEVIFNFERQ